WITGVINMVFLALVSLLYIFGNKPLIRLFSSEPAVVSAGAQCLRVVAYGYIAYAWGMVMTQAFNGAGDTFTPTKINFFCFWLLEIPLAYWLAIKLGGKQAGVYWSIVVAESMAGVVAMLLFHRGKWKLIKV